jgi:hypothetical protein
MSVINNVLKGLETRESRFTPIEITSLTPERPARRERKPLLLSGLLLVSAAVAIWLYLPQLMPNGDARANTNPTRANPAVPVAQATPEGAVVEEAANLTRPTTSNQIIGLQIRESEREMRLEFALSERTVTYLKERGENYFGYHLSEIESRIAAPVISDNPWIRELEISPSQQGVDIYFETAPDILVETRQNLVEGEPVWAIDLRIPAPPTAPEPGLETALSEPAPRSQTVVTARAARPAEDADRQAAAAPLSQEEAAEATLPAAGPEPPVRLDIRSSDPNAKSVNQLGYAVELINSNRITDAENLLRGLLDGSQDYAARQHLLALYNRQKRSDRFNRLVKESATLYPGDALFRTEYARALFKGASYGAVIRLLRDAADLDASQQALLGASHQRLDEHDDAVRHYRLSLEQDAGNARNWIGLGISQEHTAALDEALASYRRAAGLGNLGSRLQAFVDERSSNLQQVLD